MDTHIKIRQKLGKLVKWAVAEAYWRLGASDEDDYAQQFIAYSEVPPGTSNDIVVAEFEKQAKRQGRKIQRVVRGRPS